MAGRPAVPRAPHWPGCPPFGAVNGVVLSVGSLSAESCRQRCRAVNAVRPSWLSGFRVSALRCRATRHGPAPGRLGGAAAYWARARGPAGAPGGSGRTRAGRGTETGAAACGAAPQRLRVGAGRRVGAGAAQRCAVRFAPKMTVPPGRVTPWSGCHSKDCRTPPAPRTPCGTATTSAACAVDARGRRACRRRGRGGRRAGEVRQPSQVGWCPEPDSNRHGPQGQRGLSSSCLHSTIRAPVSGTASCTAGRTRPSPGRGMSLSRVIPRTADRQTDVVLFYWQLTGHQRHMRHFAAL